MGIWFPAISLGVGEQVLYRSAANSFRGWRSIGGRVTLTDRRLIFVPNRLDSMTGATRREISVRNIHSVQILAPNDETVKQRGLAASIRPQLEIRDVTDSPLVVTVSRPDRLFDLLPR